jgi:cytochrome c556
MIRHALVPLLVVAAPAAAQDIAPADYVAARQAQMAAMQALAYHVELEAEGADDLTVFRLTEEAGAIAALLGAVPMLFPEGTVPDDLPEDVVSMASPAIWEDPDGFRVAAATALEAAEALAAAPDAAALL